MNENFIVRSLCLSDDLAQVAKLIYYTDDYIFPYLYDNNVEIGISVIINMIRGNTIYNYRNITVAEIDGKIAGIIVSKETPIVMDMGEMVRCFIDANEPVGERFTKTYKEYYQLFENEPDGVYIANVCVDGYYRGKGVGKKMMAEYLKANPQKTYHLETVKSNSSALKVYQNSGFEIVNEYLGFIDIPCYRMIRYGR